MSQLCRREFIVKSSALGVGLGLMPRATWANAPSRKLNIAMIGAGNIADMAYSGTKNENLVALADVDDTMFNQYSEQFPQIKSAKKFKDFRVMLDKMGKDIDAVCINTPDHTHFVATMEAMQRGLHVCTQKPLTHSIWESRTLKKAMDKYKLVTCMANQGHTYDGIRVMREWCEAGILGKINEAHSWTEGPKWSPKGAEGKNIYWGKPLLTPPETDLISAHFDYDLWLGPSPSTPFNALYHPKCWRGFHQFGCGMLGDWMPHIGDAPVWILGLYNPKVIELVKKTGGDAWLVPDGNTIRWEFEMGKDMRGGEPQTNLKPKAPFNYYWHNGPQPEYLPPKPKDWNWEGSFPSKGSLFLGDKNTGYTDERSNNPRLANRENMIQLKKDGYPEPKYPRVPKGGPHAEWVRAIKGEGPEPGSNFDYASKFNEMTLLGCLAMVHGGRIEWDAAQMKITNRPELNVYIKPPVRKGWEVGEDLWKS